MREIIKKQQCGLEKLQKLKGDSLRRLSLSLSPPPLLHRKQRREERKGKESLDFAHTLEIHKVVCGCKLIGEDVGC